METLIKINKLKVLYGIFFCIIMCSISSWFIVEPKIFIRNVFMREWHIVLIGVISFLYFAILLYSFIKIISKTYGVVVSDEFFIDNSKYESIGKVRWIEVSKIQRIKKTSLKIYFNKNKINRSNNNLLKKILQKMHNWEYKESIIISSALLNCDISYLQEMFEKAYKKTP